MGVYEGLAYFGRPLGALTLMFSPLPPSFVFCFISLPAPLFYVETVPVSVSVLSPLAVNLPEETHSILAAGARGQLIGPVSLQEYWGWGGSSPAKFSSYSTITEND